MPYTRHHSGPGYTSDLFFPERFRNIVGWTVRQMRRIGAEAIAGSGHSGLIVAAAAAYETNLPLIAVRQRGCEYHHSSEVNGNLPTDHRVRFAIVDDLIASGATVERILMEMDREFGAKSYAPVDFQCTHILTWNYDNPSSIPTRLYERWPDLVLVQRTREDDDLPF